MNVATVLAVKVAFGVKSVLVHKERTIKKES